MLNLTLINKGKQKKIQIFNKYVKGKTEIPCGIIIDLGIFSICSAEKYTV